VLQGLSPKVIERIGLDTASTVDFSKAKATMTRLPRMARVCWKLIANG